MGVLPLSMGIILLIMSQLSAEEINVLLKERKLNNEQLTALQAAVQTYHGSASKEEIIATFRRLGFMPSLLDADLASRFGQKKEKSIRISYDLLPSGRVENFEVQEVDE
jgi:aminoglycoside phosphotransferase family enzyme